MNFDVLATAEGYLRHRHELVHREKGGGTEREKETETETDRV